MTFILSWQRIAAKCRAIENCAVSIGSARAMSKYTKLYKELLVLLSPLCLLLAAYPVKLLGTDVVSYLASV